MVSPIELRIGNPGPAHERTDTHTRCSRCRQWKANDKIRKGTRTCKDCHRMKVNLWYAKLTPEQLRHVNARSRARQNERNRRATAQRLEDCQFILTMMRNRGMSYRAIERYAGVHHEQARLAFHGLSKHVHRSTHRKLREAWDRMQEEES